FIINFLVISSAKSEQKTDAEIVNVAGRQRMLSQRIAFLAERIAKGDQGLEKVYLETIQLCDSSLLILEKGGVAPKMTDQVLPVAPKEVGTKLEIAKSLWNDYRSNALKVYENKEGAGLLFIEENALEMLTSFNGLVTAFVEVNGNKQAALDRTLWVLMVINLLAVVATILLVNRSLTKPLVKMSTAIQQLSFGKLAVDINYDSKDEIGQAYRSLKELSTNLTEVAHFAEEISRGHLETPFSPLSDQDKTGQSLIRMRDNIQQFVDEMKAVVIQAGEHGDLSSRVMEGDKEGAWGDLTKTVNNLLTAISDPLSQTKTVLKNLAQGDLSSRFSGHTVGEIKELVDSLNFGVQNISNLIASLADNSEQIEKTTTDMKISGEEITMNIGEIASAIDQMSRGSQLQMNEIDNSSSTIEKILESSISSQAKSSQITELAENNKKLSNEGLSEMAKIIDLNSQILKTSEKSNESIIA
ncbi:MAG: methyl-accepting chemotaxis protein, partial [Bacteroidota bacterium]